MTSTFKSLCVLAVVTTAGLVCGVEGDTCSYSEISDTDTALSVYADAVNANCGVNSCVSECVATLKELANYLPDCYYTDGVNYYAAMVQAITSCESGGITSSDTTETTTDGTTTSGSDCTNSQSNDVETYVAQYGDAINAYCDPNVCASDCVTTMEALAEYLPDCIYADGTNYYETFVSAIASCSGTSTDSSTTTTTGSACSASEVSDTDSYLAAVSDEYTAACTDDICSSACLEVLDTLSKELPDCVYTDGTNYYLSVEQTITSCGSTTTTTTTAPTTTDSGSSSTGTTDSNGSGSSLRTSSPAASSDSSKTNPNAAASTGMSAVSAVAAIAVLVFA